MAMRRSRGSAGAKGVARAAFLFMLAVPAFIASMVLFSVSNGNHDKQKFSPDYDECQWSKWYDTSANSYENNWNNWNRWSSWNNWSRWSSWNNWSRWSSWNNWSSWNSWSNFNSRNKRDIESSQEEKYCEDGWKKWEDWTEAKKDMRTAAISLLVLSLLLIIGGVVQALTIFYKKNHHNATRSRDVVLQYGPAVGPTTVHDGTADSSHEHRNVMISTLQVPQPDQRNTEADLPPPYSSICAMASNSDDQMPNEQHSVNPSAPNEFEME